MSFKKINGTKWLLMGIALIAFSIPFFSALSSNMDLYEPLTVFCVLSPFVGLACCVYGLLKKD